MMLRKHTSSNKVEKKKSQLCDGLVLLKIAKNERLIVSNILDGP